MSEKNSPNSLPNFMSSPLFIGAIYGLFYGLINRGLFYNKQVLNNMSSNEMVTSVFGITTFGFVFIVPLVMGYISVSTRKTPFSNTFDKILIAIFLPWIPTFLSLLAACVTGFEAMVCIIMATPAFLFMSSLGGIIGLISYESQSQKLQQIFLAGFLVLPHSISGIESQIPLKETEQRVENTIIIEADVETVWKNIERVPLIQDTEHTSSFLHTIGFPRPLEATLSKQGIGGIRHASFEDQVLFVETITEWEPQKSIAFTIEADVKQSQSAFLNTNILGGKHFDVLNGRYEIEPLEQGKIKLHLRSDHRLATHYNFYAALWTRYIMSDLQQYILKVIKRRCESK